MHKTFHFCRPKRELKEAIVVNRFQYLLYGAGVSEEMALELITLQAIAGTEALLSSRSLE